MKVRNFIFAPILLLLLGIIATIAGVILTVTLVFAAVGFPILIIGVMMIIASVLLAANLIFTSIKAVLGLLATKITDLFSGKHRHSDNKKANSRKDRSFPVNEKIIDVEEEEKGIFKVK